MAIQMTPNTKLLPSTEDRAIELAEKRLASKKAKASADSEAEMALAEPQSGEGAYEPGTAGPATDS